MNVRRRILGLIGIMFLLAVAVIGCGGGSSPGPQQPSGAAEGSKAKDESGSKANWPQAISIGGSPQGATWYIQATAIAEKIRERTGISATGEATGGGGQNVALVGNGEMEMGIAGSDTIYYAARGEGNWADKGKSRITMLWNLYQSLFVPPSRAQDNIKTFDDVQGKRLLFNAPAAPSLTTFGRAILEAYGLNESKVKIQTVSASNEVLAGLKEGTSDVTLWPNSGPANAWLIEAADALDLQYVNIGEAEMQKIVDKYPFFSSFQAPAGYFPDQDEPVLFGAFTSVMIAHKDLPEDFVYEVMKAVWDNVNDLEKYHPTFKEYNIKFAVENPVVPFHPGAIKYYKEKGVWGQEQEATQERLVAEVGK